MMMKGLMMMMMNTVAIIHLFWMTSGHGKDKRKENVGRVEELMGQWKRH